jgi:hypothetical protein
MSIQLQNSTGPLLAVPTKPVRASATFDVTHARAYNRSVDFKLQSTEYFLLKLVDTLKDFPFDSTKRGPNMFEVALFVDGFFASAVSVTDVFGRELNTYYGNVMAVDRFYLHEVIARLQAAGRGASIIQSLAAISVQHTGLIAQLKRFRNCSQHSRLINSSITMSATVDYEQHNTGGAPMAKVECFLPDDPMAIPCTYNNRIDTLTFCKSSLGQLVTALDAAYGALAAEIQGAADLPL